MIDNAFSKIRIFVHIVGDGAENKKKCKEALLGLTVNSYGQISCIK